MTLTFKDSDGREWELRAHRTDYGDSRFADPADLLSALGQLSTGSDGPTDGSADEGCARCGDTYELRANSEDSGYCDPCAHDEMRELRAGRALGDQRLAKARGERNAQVTENAVLRNELAATKTKLAEVGRERDHAHDSAEELLTENEKLRSELASARRVVEDVTDAWARYQRNDLSREEFEGFIAERFETSSPGYALASAGTDADQAEAHRKDRTDETEQHGNVRGESTPGVQTDPSVTGARVSTEVLGTVPRDGGPQRAAVSSDTGNSSARSDGFAEGAALSGRNEGLEAFAARHRSERTEPPRPEAGEFCPLHGIAHPCYKCRNEEPKPEPQASGQVCTWWWATEDRPCGKPVDKSGPWRFCADHQALQRERESAQREPEVERDDGKP